MTDLAPDCASPTFREPSNVSAWPVQRDPSAKPGIVSVQLNHPTQRGAIIFRSSCTFSEDAVGVWVREPDGVLYRYPWSSVFEVVYV